MFNREIGNVSKKGTWQEWGGEKVNGDCVPQKKTAFVMVLILGSLVQ